MGKLWPGGLSWSRHLRIISETCCCLERLVFSIIDATRAVDSFCRSEERFSRNAETDLVCRLLLEKKKINIHINILCRVSLFLHISLCDFSALLGSRLR